MTAMVYIEYIQWPRKPTKESTWAAMHFSRLTLTCNLKESNWIMSELQDFRVKDVEVFIMYSHIHSALKQEFNQRNRICVSFKTTFRIWAVQKLLVVVRTEAVCWPQSKADTCILSQTLRIFWQFQDRSPNLLILVSLLRLKSFLNVSN